MCGDAIDATSHGKIQHPGLVPLAELKRQDGACRFRRQVIILGVVRTGATVRPGLIVITYTREAR
jgi:hypothetical protein